MQQVVVEPTAGHTTGPPTEQNDYLTNGELSPSPMNNRMSNPDDDNEVDIEDDDDPGQLLNAWLGELNTLKKVRVAEAQANIYVVCIQTK